jgi:hypothetical protein
MENNDLYEELENFESVRYRMDNEGIEDAEEEERAEVFITMDEADTETDEAAAEG